MANDSVARAMAATAMSETPVYTSDLINNGTGNSPFSIVSETGHRIDLEMNTTDYKLVAKLYDKNNNLLNTSTEIDLPLESLVVNVQYDAANQKLIVTLKNGTTIDVPISGLISGLATQTWVQSQGYLTEHQSLDGKQDKYPVLAIEITQVISQEPITIQLTDAQAAIVENTGTVIMGLDLTNLGMSVNYWKRMYDLSGYVIFEDFVDGDGTQGQARYESSNKQLRYSTKQFQEKLTAGQNITISNNVISATGGGSDNVYFFTVSGPSHTPNKTYAEVRAAVEAGKRVICTLLSFGDCDLQFGLSYYSSNSETTQFMCFTCLETQDQTFSLMWSESSPFLSMSFKHIPQVSGTNDGTNWQTITIDGTTKAIPAGGGSTEDCVKMVPQVISDAQFTQAMTNLGLGAGRTSTKTMYDNDINQSTTTQSSFIGINVGNQVPSVFNTLTTSDYVNLTYVEDGVTYTGRYQLTIAGTSNAQISPNLVTPKGTVSTIRWYYAGSGYSTRLDIFYSNYAVRTINHIKIESENAVYSYSTINANYIPSGIFKSGSGDGSIMSQTASQATQTGSVAIGGSSRSTSTNGFAIGGSAQVLNSQQSVALGSNTVIENSRYCTALGPNSTVTGMSGLGEYNVAIGPYAHVINCKKAIDSGYFTYAFGDESIVLGTYLHSAKKGETIIGRFNSYENYSSTKEYHVGDVIVAKDYGQSYRRSYECIQDAPAGTSPYSSQYFRQCNDILSDYAFIIGNGTSDNARSNALTVDWDGNLVCNNIPAAPTTDGNYVLKCSIVDGVATYSWVAE